MGNEGSYLEAALSNWLYMDLLLMLVFDTVNVYIARENIHKICAITAQNSHGSFLPGSIPCN